MSATIAKPKLDILASSIAKELQTLLRQKTGLELDMGYSVSNYVAILSNPSTNAPHNGKETIKVGKFVFTPKKNAIKIDVNEFAGLLRSETNVEIKIDIDHLPRKIMFFGMYRADMVKSVSSIASKVLKENKEHYGLDNTSVGLYTEHKSYEDMF